MDHLARTTFDGAMTTSTASAPRLARVLITGATGKTGRRVVGALREQGIAVHAASRGSACAAVALTESGPEGKIYELTGPGALPLAEVADIISRYLGRPVDYPPATEEELAAHLTGEAVPAEDAAALASMSGEASDGRNSSTANGVVGLPGRPGRSFADFARDAALAGAWGSTVEVSA
jgi:uncharacterized protein YbjT (DUF2867 family)